MRYFDYLYIKLYITKNYKKLILKSLRLDDSNKIPFEYIFLYTLTAMYKISLNDK